MKKIALLAALCVLISCKKYNEAIDFESVKIDTLQGKSFSGETLVRRQIHPEKDSLQIVNYLQSLDNYNSNPMNDHFIIWLGRRIAYLGDYQKAIQIYSEGISKFPEDARFYRHRGHRYISTRQLDKAIIDFEKASDLISGSEDIIEPDGIPNKLNTPLSTLHTNIFYHKGLAHYLKNELKQAYNQFEKCLNASKNDDMIVASKHWLYMILRRLQQEKEALALLNDVNADMTIIENDGYHQLLLFYKGELSEEEVRGNDGIGSSEAVQYGVANWHHYNGAPDTAKTLYQAIVNTGNWAAFGYIAAEADLSRM